MSSIVYEYGRNLYINLTNRCPCACSFCIRLRGSGAGSADDLWLRREPSASEVLRELDARSPDEYGELVFCGYGEPFCALDALLEICRVLKGRGGLRIRVDTNGLGDLINGKPVAPLLRGLVDKVSVSLNAPDARRYDELCAPQYGQAAFPAILKFALECKEHVPEVIFTVVDVILPDEIKACAAVAAAVGVPLRVRKRIV
ncbi:MAG: TatD family nuclease-associated radical SAM protein [Oscillospiraceae bacterium]|jgi:TatD family-associated radical SAM protein|nr:TatD family nuclease-associated radical SAM protein [Oscillospiraceae bacterium]